jgi:potassium/chloride transporter 9
MFSDVAHPYPSQQKSIYDRSQQAAAGYPSQQSIPLSFNDLPCRAQHLILNELMRKHADDTAVLFTTLPSPVDGTGLSDEDSIHYLSDLEVLCEGLPPMLLIHSNSMTVTTNL